MRMSRLFIGLALLLCSLAYGQNLDKYVSVTAIRSVNLPPGESAYQLNVATDFATPLEQVVASLQDLGVSTENLVGVNTAPAPRPELSRLNYQFRFSVPFGKIQETAEKLEKLRRSLLDSNIELQFYGSAISPSAAAIEEARQRVIPELVAEARRKAQVLASAGQVNLGDIESMSESVSSYPPSGVGALPPAPIGPVGQLTFFFTLSVRFEMK